MKRNTPIQIIMSVEYQFRNSKSKRRQTGCHQTITHSFRRIRDNSVYISVVETAKIWRVSMETIIRPNKTQFPKNSVDKTQ